MWAPNLSSFISLMIFLFPHFQWNGESSNKEKNFLHGIPWINFNIVFTPATSYDIDPVNSLAR